MNTMERNPDLDQEATEIELLHQQLGSILETIEHLLLHDKPLLLARYQLALGEMEYQLFGLQVESQTLRRRIELMQGFLNRGEVISVGCLEMIDAQLSQELHAWRQRLLDQERALRDSHTMLESLVFVSPADVRRIKAAYRRLARLLHPDASPGNADLFEKYWSTVQLAYGNGDASLLEAILVLVESVLAKGGDDAGVSVASRKDEIERLLNLIATHASRLACLQQESPFCYADMLDNEEWLESRREALTLAIEAEAQRLAELVSRHAELRAMS